MGAIFQASYQVDSEMLEPAEAASMNVFDTFVVEALADQLPRSLEPGKNSQDRLIFFNDLEGRNQGEVVNIFVQAENCLNAVWPQFAIPV